MSPPDGAAAPVSIGQFAALLSATAPRLGQTRLIALDGRSGSGKTWLAGLLAARLDAPLIHMDDLYPGWDGLLKSAEALADWVVGPLASGRPARWRRYDWDLMRYAEWHVTAPAPVIVIEGCGAVRARLSAGYAARVWVEAPAAARRRRLRARPDWALYQPHVARWADLEDHLYQAEQTRQECDVVVANPREAADGTPRLTLHIQSSDRSTSNLASISATDTPAKDGLR
jgi:uridine kinase